MLKAFAVQEEDEGTGDIFYAEHDITARKAGANEYNGGDLHGITCRRAPWADRYAPGPCSRLAMVDHGWWFECYGCGIRIDSDLEHIPDDPEQPVLELKPIESGHSIWCTAKCQERDRSDRIARKDAEAQARAAIEAKMLAKLPGIEIAGETHVYVEKRDGAYVPKQVRAGFTFPGCTIGPAHFGHNEIGEEPFVTVCQGDLAAWETWRASIQPAA